MASILVLDDNNEIIALLSMVLERDGHQVIAGRSGLDGVDLLDQLPHGPDLILCNWLMPNMDGIAFLDMVRSHNLWASIPFVLMSALSSQETRQQAMQHGANGFLAKPFRFDDLHNLLRDLGINSG